MDLRSHLPYALRRLAPPESEVPHWNYRHDAISPTRLITTYEAGEARCWFEPIVHSPEPQQQ